MHFCVVLVFLRMFGLLFEWLFGYFGGLVMLLRLG
jgi:hypothetical protein